MAFAVGSLVKARGREWVVLPESEEQLLMLRPLGGTEDEVAGVYLPLEKVEPASFQPPNTDQLGDFRSCRLLRDAVRLGFRSSAGPFRSFGRIAVEPRPYQLVPLLMALKLDPVRLLIADDVGIGKTVEACLIARELLDRGEITRFAVLCPPHLAEQWQLELDSKFHIPAELVLTSTAKRLERSCFQVGQSLFDVHPFTVVSTDFIKSETRRMEFLRSAPELIIVDEAHTCASGFVQQGGRHLRHSLVQDLSKKTDRHLILVTATPHSGNEAAFRSLLELLKPEFASLPDDLSGDANRSQRERLAQYLVQRLRDDVRAFDHSLDRVATFPDRHEPVPEPTYELSPAYKAFFQKVLRYARETVKDSEGSTYHQRIRWWSVLALLRAVSSSPAAAAATMRKRSDTSDTEDPAEADELGTRAVLDLDPEEAFEGMDVTAGADPGDKVKNADAQRRRLLELAKEAEGLAGDSDHKLRKGITLVKDLLKDGFSPIVFCRFIATANYVAAALREQLKGVEVAAVTGELPPEERKERIAELGGHAKRVLVCTDCLSEGVNLQDHFDAVLHYDLAWNPTRHEQRAGRVDRYGQPKPLVRVVTYYGADNPMDGIILEVLLRKHRVIKNRLGVSISMPADSRQLMKTLMEGLLLRGKKDETPLLSFMYEGLDEDKKALHAAWERAAERRSRSIFNQQAIKVEEVSQELSATNAAIGSGVDVGTFVCDAIRVHGGVITPKPNGVVHLDLKELPRSLKDLLTALRIGKELAARFELPVAEGVAYLSRTHPLVENLAAFVMQTALDAQREGIARRCGVTRTNKVPKLTTLLLVRNRYHIHVRKLDATQQLLAEDSFLLGFRGTPDMPEWLDNKAAEDLLALQPEGNVAPEIARQFLKAVLDGIPRLAATLDKAAKERGDEILKAHIRVRSAARTKNVRFEVEPKLPSDVLGVYVFVPKA